MRISDWSSDVCSSDLLVPLPRQAVALYREIEELNVYRAAGNMRLGRYLFPVPTSKSLVISENRMLDILYRMGLRGKATVQGLRGLEGPWHNESGLLEPNWKNGSEQGRERESQT